jgi:hypothetical protein
MIASNAADDRTDLVVGERLVDIRRAVGRRA